MSQQEIINKWYQKRMDSGKLSQRQKEQVEAIKNKAIQDGSTAFEYERNVRELLSKKTR
ncbi:MAG: hypothetical protein J6C46_12200 [Clostridia bacterium]|nr:hypothetical protein [Clostridia bacterium]